jgi:hypothetical protein
MRSRWPSLSARLLEWYRPPRRRSADSPDVSDLLSMPIQKNVLLEVYWVDLGREWGPAASVFIGAHEVLRLDCFGGRTGHLHANPRQQVGRRSRMYFPEGSIEEHIDRAAFELERNLAWCLDRNYLRSINRLHVDAEAASAASAWMRRAMRELLERRVERVAMIEPV